MSDPLPGRNPQATRRVMVAIDERHQSQKAIPHAIAVAGALGAEVVLLHVLEPMRCDACVSDPIEWRLLRQAAESRIHKLAREDVGGDRKVRTFIEEGRAADQICRLVRESRVDLTVICSHGKGASAGYTMGSTARAVIDCAQGSVLVVPAQIEDRPIVRFRRIIVPLDGSSRAESVLPLARTIAEFHRAELLLTHAIPEPELTEIGPPQPEDEELRAGLMSRNERVAREYLVRLRATLCGNKATIRVLMLRGGDARHLLMRAIDEHKADLVILSSHGHGGHLDMAAGSVTAHLSSHASVPVLIVRQNAAPLDGSHSGDRPLHSSDTRFVPRAAA